MNGRGRHWATVALGVTAVASIVALLVVAFVALGSVIAYSWNGGPEPVRTEFQYESGLECVQVVLGDDVALSCTYPPGEARFGSFLDQFSTEQP